MYKIVEKNTPNKSRRKRKISLIVLHSTGGNYSSATDWLTNRRSRVSAHYIVPRDIDKYPIIQCADIKKYRTWHAGRALWNGERNINDVSVGIEQEHFDGKQEWPAEQVKATAWVCSNIMKKLNKKNIDITGHANVAIPRGRKIDPYHYPWEMFHKFLNEFISPAPKKKKEDVIVIVNGHKIQSRLLHSRTYVQVKSFVSALKKSGLKVKMSWNSKTKTANIIVE